MIYQVNHVELGINQVLQLIELIYGEGKLLSVYNLFVYNIQICYISPEVPTRKNFNQFSQPPLFFILRSFWRGVSLAYRNTKGSCKQVGGSEPNSRQGRKNNTQERKVNIKS